MKMPAQRVAVLVDAENVEVGARKEHGGRVDYAKLLDAVNGRDVVRALYFTSQERLSGSFKHAIQAKGFEIKTPPKNVDCWLTVDAITLAEKCDVIVLVGGDADYVPLIWFLKSRGCRTEVWMWSDCTAGKLIEAADEFLPLTKDVLLPVPEGRTPGHRQTRGGDPHELPAPQHRADPDRTRREGDE